MLSLYLIYATEVSADKPFNRGLNHFIQFYHNTKNEGGKNSLGGKQKFSQKFFTA